MINIDSLHVTVLYIGGKSIEQVAARENMAVETCQMLIDNLKQLEGQEVEFLVNAVVKHPEVIVAQVELPAEIPCLDTPHLTLCRSSAVAPKFAKEVAKGQHSGEIFNFERPLVLRGTICLESGPRERPLKPEVASPTSYTGELLSVQTSERASRQTEPSGHVTLLQGSEEEILVLAADLAASIKERPAGPASLKLKARVQAPGRPGHIYLKWGATAGDLSAQDIGEILAERLKEIM